MKLNKIVSCCVSAAMILGLASMTMADDDALARIQEKGVLTICTDAAWPPFEFMEGENVIGVDIDIAEKIAEGLGVELNVINAAFDTLPMYLESGEADLALAAITVTEERQEMMEFSEPYCNACQSIIVKDDDDNVKCIEDLAGYIIGVHLGTTGDFLASDEVNLGVLAGTGASVQQYKDLTIAAMGLNAGDVQAIICDDVLANNLCATNEGLKCFKAVFADGSNTDEQYAVAAGKGETSLIAEVNKIVVPLLEDGTVDQFILDESAKAQAIADEAE